MDSDKKIINRDYKLVVQDMYKLYIGAQMTVSEMNVFDDVPFKVKKMFNSYFDCPDKENKTISELIANVAEDSLEYALCKQLKLKFNTGFFVEKNGKETYISKLISLEEFIKCHNDESKVRDEEIIFNKLVLMTVHI